MKLSYTYIGLGLNGDALNRAFMSKINNAIRLEICIGQTSTIQYLIYFKRERGAPTKLIQ